MHAARQQVTTQDLSDAGIEYKEVTLRAFDGILAHGHAAHQGISLSTTQSTTNLAQNQLQANEWPRSGPLWVAMQLEPLIAASLERGLEGMRADIEAFYGPMEHARMGPAGLMLEALNSIAPHSTLCEMLLALRKDHALLRARALAAEAATKSKQRQRQASQAAAAAIEDTTLQYTAEYTADVERTDALVAYALAALHVARPIFREFGFDGTQADFAVCECEHAEGHYGFMDDLLTARQVRHCAA